MRFVSTFSKMAVAMECECEVAEDTTKEVPVEAVNLPGKTELEPVEEMKEEGLLNDQFGPDSEGEKVFDVTVEALTALESIRDIVSRSIGSGGLNVGGAELLNHQLTTIYNKAGVSSAYCTPALESFTGSSQRVSTTSFALESITEKAKEIFGKLVAYVKKAIEWLKNFFAKLRNKNEANKKELLLLKNKIKEEPKKEESTDKKPESGTNLAASLKTTHIENKQLQNALSINGGGLGNAGQFIQNLTDTIKTLSSFNDVGSPVLNPQYEKIVENIGRGVTGDLLNNYRLGAFWGNLPWEKKEQYKLGLSRGVSKLMLGNRVFEAVIPEKERLGRDAIACLKEISFDRTVANDRESNSPYLPKLTIDDKEKIIELLQQMIEIADKSDQHVNNVEKAYNDAKISLEERLNKDLDFTEETAAETSIINFYLHFVNRPWIDVAIVCGNIIRDVFEYIKID